MDNFIVSALSNTVGKVLDKFWMNKSDKEKLEFSKEELLQSMKLKVFEMAQDGEFKKIEQEFRESQAQRDYAQAQFGTADILSKFLFGKVILFGRSSIRWIITGFAAWQTHRIVTYVLAEDVIKALADGSLSTTAIWLVSTVVCMVVGIPLFYVAGISIEKLFKSRGVI